MNYWLTGSAKDDLLSIWVYTADRWNEEQADRYIDALDARFAWLTKTWGFGNRVRRLGKGFIHIRNKAMSLCFGNCASVSKYSACCTTEWTYNGTFRRTEEALIYLSVTD